MAHFYLDDTLATQWAEVESSAGEAIVHLRGADARHAAAVARVRAGEPLRLGDGAGFTVEGVVVAVEPGDLTLAVERVERVEQPTPSLHLVQALAKGDRDELAVQAATELGVDRIIPWQAARSVSRWDSAKAAKNRERWQTIAREATKQSMGSWMPTVEPLASTADLVARVGQSTVLVLDPRADTALTALDRGDFERDDIVIVVGPEGGVTPAELEQLVSAGARAVRLGTTVLRTSTAGPAAIAVLSAALGRW